MANSYIFLALVINITTFTGAAKIQWEDNTYNGEFLLRRPDPVGFERPSTLLFLCRGMEDSDWVPGKLYSDGNEMYCTIARHGEINVTSYQMLYAPPGTTSWVPVVAGTPDNAIEGGSHDTGDPAYICRGEYNGKLVVGGFGNPYCYVPAEGGEQRLWANIEVLVKNAYGVIIDA